MKNLIFIFTFLFASVAMASGSVISELFGFFPELLAVITDIKGADTLAVVAAVTQVLIKLLKLPATGALVDKLTKGWKLTVVSGLTLVSSVTSLMIVDGLSLAQAFVHSTILTSLMVFANQIYQKATEK